MNIYITIIYYHMYIQLQLQLKTNTFTSAFTCTFAFNSPSSLYVHVHIHTSYAYHFKHETLYFQAVQAGFDCSCGNPALQIIYVFSHLDVGRQGCQDVDGEAETHAVSAHGDLVTESAVQLLEEVVSLWPPIATRHLSVE